MNERGASAGQEPLAILAAGGSVPVQVAAAAVAAGRPVFVVGLEGLANERLHSFPSEMVKWGQIGRILELIEAHGARDVVLIGSVDERPDLRNVRLDLGGMRMLPKLVALLAGGDDNVLSGLTKLIESKGYRVVGAHEVAPDLVAQPGAIAGPRPSAAALADAALAMEASRRIGDLDCGQATVVVEGRVIALEGAEGTDAMLRRVADLRRTRRVRWSGRSGVLAKCAKPQQDIRVDMPTIGPQTVRIVAEAELAGIVVEPRRVMIAERAETVAAAKETGTFVVAADGDGDKDGT